MDEDVAPSAAVPLMVIVACFRDGKRLPFSSRCGSILCSIALMVV